MSVPPYNLMPYSRTTIWYNVTGSTVIRIIRIDYIYFLPESIDKQTYFETTCLPSNITNMLILNRLAHCKKIILANERQFHSLYGILQNGFSDA